MGVPVRQIHKPYKRCYLYYYPHPVSLYLQKKRGDGCFLIIHVCFPKLSRRWELRHQCVSELARKVVTPDYRWSFVYHLPIFDIPQKVGEMGGPCLNLGRFSPLIIWFLHLGGIRKFPCSDFASEPFSHLAQRVLGQLQNNLGSSRGRATAFFFRAPASISSETTPPPSAPMV